MEVRYDHWTQGSMTITAIDTRTPLYTVKSRFWTSNLDFESTDNPGHLLAHTKFKDSKYTFKTTWGPAEAAPIKISTDKKWAAPRVYDSIAFQQRMTWNGNHDWGKIEFVCLDQRGLPIARFKGSNKWKKAGTIELDPAYSFTRAQRDEIVVLGVSMMWQLVQNLAAAAGAVAVF